MKHTERIATKLLKNSPLLLFLCSIAIFALHIVIDYSLVVTYQMTLLLPLLLIIALFIIITIVLLYNAFIKSYKPEMKFIYFTGISFLCLSVSLMYRYGAFNGETDIEAVYFDDLGRFDLKLYKNGKYLIEESWLFGVIYSQGKYKNQNDTISFSKGSPAKNSRFIPNVIVVNRSDNVIYFKKKTELEYDTNDVFEIGINTKDELRERYRIKNAPPSQNGNDVSKTPQEIFFAN